MRRPASSEYDPPFGSGAVSPAEAEAFEAIRERFREAARPYLASPWTWLTWGLVLPAAALATPAAARAWGLSGVLLLWSGAILAGGAVEAGSMMRRGTGSSPIAAWALRVQGNLSLVAVALSAVLVVADEAWALPGLWLLLLGHCFFSLGGLSEPLLRRYGLAYQVGGVASLAAHSGALPVFAVTAALANLGLALALWLRRRAQVRPQSGSR